MKKEELEKLLAEKVDIIDEQNDKILDLMQQNKNMKSRNNLIENRFAEVNKARAYIEGQLSVLKRLSGYYIEEIPTRDEYKESTKEILSSNPDWRYSLDSTPDDLPF